MTAEEVDRRETDNFLDWRREISQMEEKFPSMKVRYMYSITTLSDLLSGIIYYLIVLLIIILFLYYFIITLFHYFIISLFYYFIILLFHYFITSLLHYFIILSFHYFIIYYFIILLTRILSIHFFSSQRNSHREHSKCNRWPDFRTFFAFNSLWNGMLWYPSITPFPGKRGRERGRGGISRGWGQRERQREKSER